jgi:predicted metal-dependent HD superfamily phosphohydrolase
MRHLADAWVATLRRVGARDDIAHAGVEVISAYADGRRRYHDLRHLDDVLRNVDDLAPYAADADAVRIAAWFHDVVYDPTRSDNERQSAVTAERTLHRLRVDKSVVQEVCRLVLLTETHDPAADDRNGAVLCDADLAVLASDPQRYAEYAAAVREEYSHVADDDFRRGRAGVLRSLLALPVLFRTPYGHAQWEATARHNLQTELTLLSAGGDETPPVP